MRSERRWQWLVERVAHFRAIENMDHYLSGPLDEMPWDFAVGVEPGGTMRLATSVSATVRARHPSGLTFRWFVDYELREANGAGDYRINVSGLTDALNRMPPVARDQFGRLLADTVAAVRKNAGEYRAIAMRQEASAAAIESVLAPEATDA